MLRPDKSVQKVLLSTTSRLVGEYVHEDLLVTHAWPNFSVPKHGLRYQQSPISRSAYIFAFDTPSDSELLEKTPVIQYSYYADIICSYLSLLYGKRFDNHGLTEESGFFHLPSLSQFNELCDPNLPQNTHKPRIDLSVPLNLEEISRLNPLFFGSIDDRFLNTFRAACKFYSKALQVYENDAEIAYLNLITAGEVLSNYFHYSREELILDDMKSLILEFNRLQPDSNKLIEAVTRRLLHIKRRFTKTIASLLDEDFFLRTESEQYGSLSHKDIQKVISAAYDLRSKYVHSGIPFGSWIRSHDFNNEIQIGRPLVEDKDFGKILAMAPTFIGLERIIRYCLLQFAKQNGAYIEP